MDHIQTNDPDIYVRPMLDSDWPEVSDIYLDGIATGIATFETTVPTWEVWNASHLRFARLVAESEGQVTGWVALSPVSGRCVYGGVAEVSIYISPIFRSRGVGRRLMSEMITQSEENGIWTLQAGIFPENSSSVRLHEVMGFRIVGHREKIGKLDQVWKDNYLMERRSAVIGL